MELFLSNESTIREINKEFQKKFPFLKLKFYKYRSTTGENSYWKDKFSGQITLKEMGGKLIPVIIKIDPLDTVAELEKRFHKNHGLRVQVFRKSGDIWIETAHTDALTLEKQTASGQQQRYNIHTLFL
jgi:hypothetical protein